MEIIPLGTASAIPTRHRHLSGLALVREGHVLLFDCGEGTQMQLIHAGVKLMRIEAIFISHFHGDHFYGLFGLLATLALLKRTSPLTVVGPEGIGDVVRSVPGLAPQGLPFEIVWVEVRETVDRSVVFETGAYVVESRPLAHRDFSAGFKFAEKPRTGKLDVERAAALGITDYVQFRRLKQGSPVRVGLREVRPEEVVGPPVKGRAFAYVSDTRPCRNGVLLAREADLLYHEATFGDDLAERAKETGHATASEAASVAKEAGASRLLIGHFSARYADPEPLVTQARTVFPSTDAAEELRSYTIG